jgi:hypothetical protein
MLIERSGKDVAAGAVRYEVKVVGLGRIGHRFE